jgi:ABC-type nickel/cobalt efflux system permease component RcnA
MRRLFRIAGLVATAVLAAASAAGAHPLGNFTVNHLSRLTFERGTVHVRYVLDLAEIPTFALDRSLDPRGTPLQATLARWADDHAKAIAPQLDAIVDGRAVALTPAGSAVRTRPGAGGLPTLYFTAGYVAGVGPGRHRITYRDTTESGRLGWKDVVAGTMREPTDELRTYPNALIGSPRSRTGLVADVDAAGRFAVDASADGVSGDDVSAATPLARSNALSDVLAKGAGDPLIVLGALLLALALGALHALEPGHGKTLLAVSLVGARATPRQAVILATALTVAHTAGVLALGAGLLLAAQWIVPEQIYPWITLASGVLVTVLGARAVAREVRVRLPFAHAHTHAHPHAHPHEHGHVHAGGAHHHHHDAVHDHAALDDAAHAREHAIPGTAPLTFRSAVLAAASGNVAPCPAALVVLLAAIALHRIGYGMVLIVAFSIGLAAVLTVLGIAVVRSAAWLVSRPRFDRATRWAPLLTAFVIATVGAVMVGQGFVAQGLTVPVPLVAALILVAVVGYAFAWHRHGAPAGARA